MYNFENIIFIEGRIADTFRLLINFLLIALLAQSSADITWRVLGAGEQLSNPPVQAPKIRPVLKSQAKAAAALHPLVNISLFGIAARTGSTSASPPPENIPPTTLNLVLKGVVAVRPGSRALAIINEKGGRREDGIYVIGNKVPGNAIIREIHPESVLLLRAGKLETLLLEDELAAAKGASGQTIASRGDDRNWTIGNSYWQSMLTDVASLAKEIGLKPYKKGRTQQGFEIISSRGSKTLNNLGLRSGDIVREVNGIKLINANRGLTAYQKVKNASEIRLLIERNGRMETKIYTIN